MRKISYELVVFEMGKLWLKEIDINDSSAVKEHCLLLQSFVEACGWDIISFTKRMMDSKFIN